MKADLKQTQILLNPWACIMVAFSLLTVGWQWTLSWLISAFVHEMFHMVAILLVRGNISQVKISTKGMEMITQIDSFSGNLISSLAGPAGSALILLFSKSFPRLALCATVHLCFNLLPIYPLDGGRVIKLLLSKVLSASAVATVMMTVENAILILITATALVLCFACHLGALPMLALVMIVLRIKKPCKGRAMRVQ